ncbi:MAG: hypothetical protein ACYC27_01020 [Armatimonadota bacterium]
MNKKIFVLIATVAMVCLLSVIGMAAPSFLGTSGNVFTPNDSILEVGDLNVNLHSLQLGDSITIFGANMGVTDNLELGIGHFDSKAPGAKGETFLNAKYAILPETAGRPSVVVGLTDATGELDVDGDPGLYVVLGKNLTRVASDVTGEPVGSLRGYFGVGTGIYKGFFIAADYTLTPKAHVVAEYLSELGLKNGVDEKNVLNAAIRFSLTDTISADLAFINAEDLGFGITYTKIGL